MADVEEILKEIKTGEVPGEEKGDVVGTEKTEEVIEKETEKTEEVIEEVPDFSKKPDRLRKMAIKMGFREDGDFDDETYVDNARKINITQAGTIQKLRREVRETNRLVTDGLRARVEERNQQLTEEITKLDRERDDAIDNSDKEEVHRLDTEIESRKKYMVDTGGTKEKNTVPSERDDTFENWKSENSWYGKDKDLTEMAEIFGGQVEKAYPDIPFEEMLEKVRERIEKYQGNLKTENTETVTVAEKKTEKSSEPQEKKPIIKRSNTVEAGHETKVSPKKKITEADLTPSQRAAAKNFIKMEVFKNIDEYINEMSEEDKVEILKSKERQ